MGQTCARVRGLPVQRPEQESARLLGNRTESSPDPTRDNPYSFGPTPVGEHSQSVVRPDLEPTVWPESAASERHVASELVVGTFLTHAARDTYTTWELVATGRPRYTWPARSRSTEGGTGTPSHEIPYAFNPRLPELPVQGSKSGKERLTVPSLPPAISPTQDTSQNNLILGLVPNAYTITTSEVAAIDGNEMRLAIEMDWHNLRPKGVEFISNATVKVTRSSYPQVVLWEEKGFRMYIPAGALGESEEREIAISTSHSGHFVIPDGVTPVSFVYYVEPSGRFHKPVTLEIEHCCNLDEMNASDLVFAFAECSSKRPPYTFHGLDGGNFSSVSSYGSSEVSNFSLFGIWSKADNANCNYFAHVFYQCSSSCSVWNVAFVVTERLGECLQVVKREYKDWKQILSTPLYFEAESNVLSIDIPAEGVVINEAWKIFPSSTPLMIEKSEITHFPPSDQGYKPSSCQMSIELQPGGIQNTHHIGHYVKVKGLKSPDGFRIVIPIPQHSMPNPGSTVTGLCSTGNTERATVTGSENTCTGHGCSTGAGCNGYDRCNGVTEKLTPGTVLSVNELSKLVNLLSEPAYKWYSIGIQLKLTPGQLDAIAQECNIAIERLTRMLERWLGSKFPTITLLAEALESQAVGEVRLAEKLRQTFK